MAVADNRAQFGTVGFNQATPNVIPSMKVAAIFAYRGTDRFSFQSLKIRPVTGCARSHRLKRSDDFEKQKADSKMKGVVGTSGRKIPIMPAIRLRKPSAINKRRKRINLNDAPKNSGPETL